MTKAQITIDIPDGYEMHKVVDQSVGFLDDQFDGRRLLVKLLIDVKKTWQWPAWLKCDWVARNENGRIAIGNGKSRALEKVWGPSADGGADYFDADSIAIDLPPCTDWRQSLRLNPNREAKP